MDTFAFDMPTRFVMERGGTCGFFQVLSVDDVEQIFRNAR